jgi:hypothetical protein
MKMPKTTDEAKAAFRSLVPDDERVTIKPMFGSLAAFAGGQMFMGILGEAVMFRLGEAERQAELAAGATVFEPMPGRPMREYVSIPNWRDDTARSESLASRSLEYALSLPPKKK